VGFAERNFYRTLLGLDRNVAANGFLKEVEL
jgi:hypothetical protein